MDEILLVIVHTGKKGGRKCRESEREGEKVVGSGERREKEGEGDEGGEVVTYLQ